MDWAGQYRDESSCDLFSGLLFNDILGIDRFGWVLSPESSLPTDNYQWMMIAVLPLIFSIMASGVKNSSKFFYIRSPDCFGNSGVDFDVKIRVEKNAFRK